MSIAILTRMTSFLTRFWLAPFVALGFLTACDEPFTGREPNTTWLSSDTRNEECLPDVLRDPQGASWTRDGRAVLADRLAHGEPVVASVLGCHVEVLDRCHAPSKDDAISATELRGECRGATHVVRGTGERVTLDPLTLAGYHLDGTWHGRLRQPKGAYETLDITLELEREGNRVKGVSLIRSPDDRYWGTFRIDGRLEGNVLYFADVALVDTNAILATWSPMEGYLVLDPADDAAKGQTSFRGFIDIARTGENRHLLLAKRSE